MACAFSSSDEYEADLIRERRAAGVYGPTQRQRRLFWGGMIGALLVLVVISI